MPKILTTHTELAITEKAKDLGVKLNSSMKVLSQCSSTVKKKGYSTLGIIGNDIENRDANIFVPLYKSMLRWNTGCSFGHYTSERI